MTSGALTHLPDEILAAIFQYLDVTSVLALNQTSRRFVALANEPLLWRNFCDSGFRYWSDRRAFRTLLRSPEYDQWKALYASRLNTTRTTKSAIHDIINDPVGRSDRIQAIVDHGYEVKDTLINAFHNASESLDHLSQKYWSHVALGCLHRSTALEEWSKIRYRSDIEHPTERALAAFDMFILEENREGDIDDIFDRLDSYVAAVRQAYPGLDEQTPRQRAVTIAAYLRERHWVGIDENREYHSLDHMFLGVALFSRLRNSLPLITAVIYCYVCRHFNLRAQPCNYPMHVHALVQPPPGFDLEGNIIDSTSETSRTQYPDNPTAASSKVTNGQTAESSSSNTSQTSSHPQAANITTSSQQPSAETHLYMDPFQTDRPVSLSYLRQQIRFMGLPGDSDESVSYISAATQRDLLIRSAYNIINSTTRHTGPLDRPIPTNDALYAAYFSLILFPTHPTSLRRHISELTQHFLHAFDHDIHIFRNHVLPLTASLPDAHAYHNLAVQLLHAELERPKPKFRPTKNAVFYRVGQIFRHRRQGYLACIYGWDASCQMSNQWISMNQVDRLPKGRHQPFYNAYVADDGTTRYVAEENIILIGKEEEGGNGEMLSRAEIESFGIEVGKWFRRFDWGTGRFVSNVRDEYPED